MIILLHAGYEMRHELKKIQRRDWRERAVDRREVEHNA